MHLMKGRILIQVRANHPFFYILLEQRIVLMYRIDTPDYVTMSDITESSNWTTYELSAGEDFEMFDHRNKEPITEKGIFISQRDSAHIADEINIHIQRNKRANRSDSQTGAIHIVTSESAAGSLKSAIDRPKTVIGFPDDFSIGPLWKLEAATGQEFRREWLFDNINFEQEEFEYENKFRNALRQIEDIAPDSPIYLWFGENAEEQTGLRFYLYLLREKPNKIFLMNTTQLYKEYVGAEDGSAFFHTGLLDSKILRLFFEKARDAEALSEEKRICYRKQWNALWETTEVLRVWKDGQILAVPEEHYDALILEAIKKFLKKQKNKEYILAAQVVGDINARSEEFIDYFFLEYRIRELVYKGVLDIKGVPKSMRHYRVKIR